MPLSRLPLLVAITALTFSLAAHDIRAPKDVAQADTKPADAPPATSPSGVSGQAPLRFKLFKGREILPAEAQAVLVNAHGGFAVDRREGKGQIYFALPGAGILQIAADLQSVKLIDSPDVLKPANMHNAKIWFVPNGEGFLTFPGNDIAKVITTTLDGKLAATLDTPSPEVDFDEPKVNEYFRHNGKFIPTDVEELDGMFYITTGYSALDYVLTARIESTSPFVVKWNDLAFGGKGNGPGQFGTGHGITVPPGTKRLDVADRPHSEIDRFTRYGHYRSTVSLPPGCLPCDTDFEGDLMVIGCLEGPDKTKGAPIYLLKNDQIVSTIMPKEDFGLDKFTHVHNATIRTVNGKLYIIAQAWNPGDFAIFEQVE
ncbi:hypothetical protein HY256_05235 [Candidatus Sumerlaeota bacterium]|nr:hypothetical protein [Candidatus Sumerlaeota bacterium]